jgi:4-diphosphocytidyl-2-C-methyl-D-erythritol kinase
MTKTQNSQSGWAEKWPAPAKLNLMLRITGRRDDGYHLLQTVFQIIDLCDWLTFHLLDEDRVCLVKPIHGVAEADDLTVRAGMLLKAETGYKGGVRIEVEKNLPMGGGLGGGSSDAATTLMVLNKLWGLGLSQQRLMQLGLSLGADVPVFIFGYSAWAEGVGEFLKKINIPEPWYVVVKPDCHVQTKEIFCAEELTRDSKPITMGCFTAGQQENDCLAVVRKLYLPVDKALRVLSGYGESRLTGTGACVFAQFEDKSSAEKAFSALKQDWEVYLAKGKSQSPLLEQLDNIF